MSVSVSERPRPVADRLPVPEARALYIGPPERRLFAWHHAPHPAAPRNAVIVLCAPIANESTGAHRAFRHWAEGLARAGFHAVRFDYHGFGDSAGSPEDPQRLRAWLDSVGDAVSFARSASGAPHVVLAGLHFGATLALGAAAERGDVDALVLWVPYATGRAYLREGRAFTQLMADSLDPATNPLPKGAEQIGGLMITAETAESLAAFDPLSAGRVAIPTLLIPRDAAASDTTLMKNLSSAGATVERRVAEGYTGVMTEPHESRVPTDVIATSVQWLSAQFPEALVSAPPKASSDVPRAMVVPPRDGGAAVEESPLRFGGSSGLFGILSRPSSALQRETTILLLNAGAVYRAGPNRVYVELARRWAALGYTVLRMDVAGLGDSPTPPGAVENHSYPSHVIDNIETALDALRELGATRIVVAGLCSGAHATFHAGRELDSVDGLMLINPIVFYWKPTDPLDVGAWKTYVEARYYKQSARQWNSWLRLLSGRVNLAYVASVGFRRGAEIARAKISSALRAFRREIHEPEHAARDLFRLAASGTDVLLLFSVGDPGLNFLEVRYPIELKRLHSQEHFALRLIEDADHTFTAYAARRRAADALTEHLLARHP
jgi:dienelactone hydrolase